MLKQENKNENELQIHLAEILGILFKTHKDFSQNLVQQLFNVVLPEVAKHETKQKQKFLLFILDDMVEFLGPDFLGPQYLEVVEKICSFTSSKFSAIRQASVYGVGMVAQHGGAAFAGCAELCLKSLKVAIDFPMDAATKEKKSKATQFHHARDNSVAALGKVLQYQPTSAPFNEMLTYWMSLLPLTHDMEEAKIQNEFLANSMLKSSQTILGENNERLEQFVMILGEICQRKQSDPGTLDKLSVVIADLTQSNGLVSNQFQALCQSKLAEANRARIQEVYGRCNEETRAKVQQALAGAQ